MLGGYTGGAVFSLTTLRLSEIVNRRKKDAGRLLNLRMQVKNLYEYLDLIRVRPAMYVGENSIKALSKHIEGFYWAEKIHHVESSPDFHGFNDFVAAQYKLISSVPGWANIILDKMMYDEDNAVKEFFRLIDLFREQSTLI